MKISIRIAFFIGIAPGLFGQKDSSQVQLQTVVIESDSALKNCYPNMVYLEFDSKEIQNSANDDLGTILSRSSNVTLKDYGGVGGLKTVSVRGFSSNHTGVFIGGLPLQNQQTGSVNLGNLRSENMSGIQFGIGSVNASDMPVRANSYVSSINITPSELREDYKDLKLRVSGSYGSFNTIEPFLGINTRYGKRKANRIGVNLRYLYSDSNYPFSFQNGGSTVDGKRKNSRVATFLGNIGGIHQLKKGKLSYRTSFYIDSKQLPGAIILYDSTESRQQLVNQNFSGQLKYFLNEEKWSVLAFGSYRYDYIHYQDPDYLNSTGGLDDEYWQSNWFGGFHFGIKPAKRLELLIGMDEALTTLTSNKSTLNHTWRSDLRSMIGINYSVWRIKFQLNGILTYITDQNQDKTTFESLKLNPYFSMGIYPIKNSLFHIRFFYKNSLRPPTMNELYYNQIIKNIQPETAHQLNLGMSYKIINWTWFEYFNLGVDFYKNFVRNKIILLPTQNLFVWSIQNVGKVDVTGMDFNVGFKTKEEKPIRILWDFKYTLLLAQDVTDPNSKTYRNQLPYTSKDNFSTTVGFEFLDFGISWGINYGGPRYSLAENIEMNKLPSYLINDLSLYYNFKFKEEKHLLRIKLDVRNILNEQYVLVKSFPMPGINFNVKLVYEFTR
ncbi:MAG: TonB-dependent receptor [Crocinitomicaceae bacterium]|nr:TonB-dependent receptor [Crocinitomicaceae bacterium]